MSYTGNSGTVSTVGHGLGTTPDLIIFKGRTIGQGWIVWNQEFNARSRLVLNGTNAISTTQTNFMNDTLPSSSVFTIGNDADTNNGTDTYIAYCFTEKKGYSKFGTYSGNSSTNGSYIHLGFKPALVICKSYTYAGASWRIIDNKREGYNPANDSLKPNDTTVEFTSEVDFLSNGFKWRNTNGDTNTSGRDYIYIAFSESSFVNSNGVPTNAR